MTLVKVCQPCQYGKHDYCHISMYNSNCQCPECVEINHNLTKKTLDNKYEKITGVKIQK